MVVLSLPQLIKSLRDSLRVDRIVGTSAPIISAREVAISKHSWNFSSLLYPFKTLSVACTDETAAPRSICFDCKYWLTMFVCSRSCFNTTMARRNSKLWNWCNKPLASAAAFACEVSFSIVRKSSTITCKFASTALIASNLHAHLVSQSCLMTSLPESSSVTPSNSCWRVWNKLCRQVLWRMKQYRDSRVPKKFLSCCSLLHPLTPSWGSVHNSAHRVLLVTPSWLLPEAQRTSRSYCWLHHSTGL